MVPVPILFPFSSVTVAVSPGPTPLSVIVMVHPSSDTFSTVPSICVPEDRVTVTVSSSDGTVAGSARSTAIFPSAERTRSAPCSSIQEVISSPWPIYIFFTRPSIEAEMVSSSVSSCKSAICSSSASIFSCTSSIAS